MLCVCVSKKFKISKFSQLVKNLHPCPPLDLVKRCVRSNEYRGWLQFLGPGPGPGGEVRRKHPEIQKNEISNIFEIKTLKMRSTQFFSPSKKAISERRHQNFGKTCSVTGQQVQKYWGRKTQLNVQLS